MRRGWLCIAILPGLIALPSLAAAKHSRTSAHHAQSSAKAAKASVTGGAGKKAGSKGAPRSAKLRHAKKKSARLKTTQPIVTAVVDPVPLGHFPLPAPMKGSHDSLVRQNVRAEADGLSRIQDDDDLLAMRRGGELVALPASSALRVDERLPVNRRYCRSWAALFLSDLSRVHYGRFHRPIQVNSAVRTVEYQRRLGRTNGNAAPAQGDNASPHLTGATIDIAKKGLSMDEIGWMRAYLAPLQAAGKIDVEEEFYQSCFHITVYRSYHPAQDKAESKGRPGASASLLASRSGR
jgi:hypothetical protein